VDLDAVRGLRLRPARRARDLARFTLNAEEENVSPALYALFLDSYAQRAALPRDLLEGQIRPCLLKLRARHQMRSGPDGGALL
jgi:hypothetical protein